MDADSRAQSRLSLLPSRVVKPVAAGRFQSDGKKREEEKKREGEFLERV